MHLAPVGAYVAYKVITGKLIFIYLVKLPVGSDRNELIKGKLGKDLTTRKRTRSSKTLCNRHLIAQVKESSWW